jgi:hypothetical protein
MLKSYIDYKVGVFNDFDVTHSQNQNTLMMIANTWNIQII